LTAPGVRDSRGTHGRKRTNRVKLFYQSMGVARRSESGPYARALSTILRDAAEPGTEIDLQGLGPGRAIADQYRYLELLNTAEVLDNGLPAERERYDALLIGNVVEPGMHALREVLNIRAAYGDHVYPGAT
jgi:allantoin racemase